MNIGARRVRDVEDAHALEADPSAVDDRRIALEQSSAVCPLSIDWNRNRLPPISCTETSFCGPLHLKSTTVLGLSVDASRMRKPS